jgi:probable phosphoglycerate mutase
VRIYLARHGETEFNRRGLLQGRQDSSLTDLGLDQARGLGRILAANLQSDGGLTVWSSPLQRAIATAEIVLQAADRTEAIRIDERLIEIDGGGFEGMTREAVVARSPGATLDDVLLLNAPDAEPYEAVLARLASWLADAKALGGDHLVLTHAGAGRVLRGLSLGVGREGLAALRSPHDAMFRLDDGVETLLTLG